MTDLEFAQTMKLVTNRWGEKSYPNILQERILRFAAPLPQSSFEKIVFQLIDSCRSAPMPNEFRNLINLEKKNLGLEIKLPEPKPSKEAKCWDCADAGVLFGIRKEVFEPWARFPTISIRCSCEAGRSLPASQGPVWNWQYDKNYDRDPIYLDIKGDWRPRKEQGLNFMVRELIELMGGQRPKSRSHKGEVKSFGDHLGNNQPDGAA